MTIIHVALFFAATLAILAVAVIGLVAAVVVIGSEQRYNRRLIAELDQEGREWRQAYYNVANGVTPEVERLESWLDLLEHHANEGGAA